MLKVQLKKYVGAVQMLKREGQAVEGECGEKRPLVALLTVLLFAGTKCIANESLPKYSFEKYKMLPIG